MKRLLVFLTRPHQLIGLRLPGRFVYLFVAFEARDLWVGVYWNWSNVDPICWSIYICVLPMLPIVIRKYR